MSTEKKNLSEIEIRELFRKYDINNDKSINNQELTKLVTDIYKQSQNITELTLNDEIVIKNSVQKLLQIKDNNKDGILQLDEFISTYNGQDIKQTTEQILSENHVLVYSSRIARLMSKLGAMMAIARPMAYASEMGESVRPLVPLFLVRSLYGVSWGYVFLDTGIKSYSVKDQGREKMAYYTFDTAIWHTLASMAIPAYIIHTVVNNSGKLLSKFVNPASKFGKFGPTIIGMSTIPFIIHPIDHLTDRFMDSTIRYLYSHKMPVIPKHH